MFAFSFDAEKWIIIKLLYLINISPFCMQKMLNFATSYVTLPLYICIRKDRWYAFYFIFNKWTNKNEWFA